MKVCIVTDIMVHDPKTYQKYIEQVPATVAKHGGRYIVRGGKVTGESDDWKPQGRLVIIEFPSQQAFEQWSTSKEYQTIAKIREQSATARSFLTEGIS